MSKICDYCQSRKESNINHLLSLLLQKKFRTAYAYAQGLIDAYRAYLDTDEIETITTIIKGGDEI